MGRSYGDARRGQLRGISADAARFRHSRPPLVPWQSPASEAAGEPPDALGQPVAPADGSIRLSPFAALGVADRRQSGSGRYCGGRRNKRSSWSNVGLAVPSHPRAAAWTEADRKSVVEGKSVSVRVDLGGRRIL